jgi:hypothetical protein
MLGRRSQNLELIPLDLDLEGTLRRNQRAPIEQEMVEVGDNVRNVNQSENVGKPRFENQDARAKNFEQARAWNVDFTTSLKDLFALVVTSSHSCIVLPPTNTTHFDLKPHIIQLLLSFHGLDLENPYSHVKTFTESLSTLDFFLSLCTIRLGHGWILTHPDPLHHGKAC